MSHITLHVVVPSVDASVDVSLSLQLTVAEAARSCARVLSREYPLLFVPTKEEGLMLLQEPLEATDVALNPHRTLKELLDAHLIEDTAELCLA